MANASLGIILALILALPLSVSAQKAVPTWQQLSAEQQRILAPIQGEWDRLDTMRKNKWIGIAQRYPKMSPDEQARLQRRMKEWASLSPEQRQAAREKYREFEQRSPEERQAIREKWEKYRQAQAVKEAEKRAAEEAEKRAAEEAAAKPEESAAAAETSASETATGGTTTSEAPAEASSSRPQ